jgi:hypothetical protein
MAGDNEHLALTLSVTRASSPVYGARKSCVISFGAPNMGEDAHVTDTFPVVHDELVDEL